MPELCQSSHAQVGLVPGSKAHGAGPVSRGPGWAPVTQSRHRERHSMRVAPATQLCFQNTGQGETISCYSVLLIRIFTALPVLNPKQMVQLSPAPQFDDPWGLPAKCTFQRIIPQALLTLIWSLLSILLSIVSFIPLHIALPCLTTSSTGVPFSIYKVGGVTGSYGL